jgi:hypothetical protein
MIGMIFAREKKEEEGEREREKERIKVTRNILKRLEEEEFFTTIKKLRGQPSKCFTFSE